jgi:hypothetical protein
MNLARVFSPPSLPDSSPTNQLTALDRTVVKEQWAGLTIVKIELQGLGGLFAKVHNSFPSLGTDSYSAVLKIDFLDCEFRDFATSATGCIE